MAGNGPIPNRSDQRVRRNKPDVPIEKITAIGGVPVPDLGILNPHWLVRDMYNSLKVSAQKKYFEPSDWQYARLAMFTLNEMLQPSEDGKPARISAMKLQVVNQMLGSLLMTEGERRRVRIEVEREQSAGDADVVQIADIYRERLSKA